MRSDDLKPDASHRRPEEHAVGPNTESELLVWE
jgi:hypothetical protein